MPCIFQVELGVFLEFIECFCLFKVLTTGAGIILSKLSGDPCRRTRNHMNFLDLIADCRHNLHSRASSTYDKILLVNEINIVISVGTDARDMESFNSLHYEPLLGIGETAHGRLTTLPFHSPHHFLLPSSSSHSTLKIRWLSLHTSPSRCREK